MFVACQNVAFFLLHLSVAIVIDPYHLLFYLHKFLLMVPPFWFTMEPKHIDNYKSGSCDMIMNVVVWLNKLLKS